MKRSIRFRKLSLALPLLAAAVAFWAGPARATPLVYYYWDMNGPTAGAGSATPNGIWDNRLYWNEKSDGTGTCSAGDNTSYNFVFSAGDDATGNYTIEVSGTRYAKSITVKNGTPTFSGGKLFFFDGTGLIDTTTRNPLFSAVIAGNVGLTKTGSGTLTLTGANTYAGLTTVKAGTLKLVGTTAAPKAWNPVLNVGGSDIQGGKMVFDYSAVGGSSPASTIQDLMADSYHGDLYGVGAWDQGRFLSSTAGTTGLTLGWKDSGTQVTVMPTYAGDANLDGEVDGADVDIWKLNVGTTGVGVWELADFNYDGEVDGADVDIWKLNVGSSLALPPGGAGLSIVPEPGTLILLGTGVLGLLCYAWRQRKRAA